MNFFLSLAFVLTMVLNSAEVCRGETHELIEFSEKSLINWDKRSVTATGVGRPAPETIHDPDLRRQWALTAAKKNAVKNLFKTIWTINIDSNRRIGDVAPGDIHILNQLIDMAKTLPVHGQRFFPNGFTEVDIQMDMNGAFARLTLPENIKKLESIKPVLSNKDRANRSLVSTKRQMSPDVFTGLVVDAKGIGARPSISPRILDKNSREIYGAAFVSREFAVQKGISGYMTDIKAAQKNPRVGGKPLIVRGLITIGKARSDIVISNLDASKLRGASEHLIFLKKCGVIIVTD